VRLRWYASSKSRGTQVVTGLMLLANLFLLAWDYDRWKALLPRDPGPRHLGAGTTRLRQALLLLTNDRVLGGYGKVVKVV